MLCFIDANIAIYLVEQPSVWGSRATARVNALILGGDQVVVSDLVRMECRVGPLAANDTETLALFERFFASDAVQVVGITAAICDRAAAIRAQYRFRAMDALHLAAAIEHGCRRFVTHDRRFGNFPEIAVEVLE